MQELQTLLNAKPYMKNVEIRKYFDAINNVWKINLLLTITEDKIWFDFPEENDITIRFENISDLEICNMSWIAQHRFMIYDHAKNQYENQTRFQLVEDEDMLNFFFEKAEILS